MTDREKESLVENKFFIINETETPRKNLTVVDPKIFNSMTTDQGPTIGDFQAKGIKCVLFFMRSLACPFCAGTLEDIYVLHDTLYRLNTICVILYQETPVLFQEFIKLNPKFSIFYSMYQKPYKKAFGMKKASVASVVSSLWVPNLVETFGKKALLKEQGIQGWAKSLTAVSVDDQLQLAAVFVVQNNKIVSEVRKENSTDRFDLARIVIDPDQFGIEIHTSVFSCERPKVKMTNKSDQIQIRESYLKNIGGGSSCFKPVEAVGSDVNIRRDFTLKEILVNPYYRNFLKVQMTKEFNVENLIFWEEVEYYRIMPENLRIKRCKEIYETFITKDAEYELNVTQEMRDAVISGLETAPSDLFSEIAFDITKSAMSQSFNNLMNSELIIQMQQKKKDKRSLMIGY